MLWFRCCCYAIPSSLGTTNVRRSAAAAAAAVATNIAPTTTRLHSSFSTTTSNNNTLNHDVLIVGGGVVGSSLARLLTERLPSLSVGLVERGSGPFHTTATSNYTTTALPHPRAYALSPKSLQILGTAVTENVPKGIYHTMQVWEQDSPALLVFTEKDVPFMNNNNNNNSNTVGLGAVVEDAPLVRALWEQLQQATTTMTTETKAQCTLYTNTELQDLDVQRDRVTVRRLQKKQSTAKDDSNPAAAEDSSSSSSVLSTRLLVAADGANSWVRKQAGLPWEGFDYDRTALTGTVSLTHNMPPRAFQRFLPHGPVALLPTHSQRHATFVWSTTPEQAEYYHDKQQQANSNNKEDDELTNHLNDMLQRGPQRLPKLFSASSNNNNRLAYGMDKLLETVHYGLTMAHWNDYDESFVAPPMIQACVGPVFAFPLSCKHASSYTTRHGRVVLVGDAAHTVHPMAGQGLNLGLSDVLALTETLEEAYKSGMELTTFCEAHYGVPQRRRNALILRGIHTLHELFAQHDYTIVMHGKSLGMQAVNHVGPIRRQLAAIATGYSMF